MKNTIIFSEDIFEFVGKDATSLEDLIHWLDTIYINSGRIPKVIIMDKLRQKYIFSDYPPASQETWKLLRKSMLRVKINGKIYRNIFTFRAIPIIESL